MRLTGSWMLLLALAGCKHSASTTADGGAGTPAGSSSAALPAGSSTAPVPATPVPGQYGRYYVDLNRFSAAFPYSPSFKRLTAMLTEVEARADNGSAYVAICGPAVGGARTFDGAREKTVGDGKFVSDGHPQFYGTDAYEVRAQLTDGSQRIMRYIKYQARFCSVSVEFVTAAEEPAALRFIDSFRPEPPPS
jgi:hypothetical protein